MKLAAAVCVLGVLTPGMARCDELFRCGQWLVTSEISVSDLLKKCGQPSSRQVSTEDVRAHVVGGGSEKLGTTTKEVWRYDRGSRAGAMIVTIVDGRIQSMERGK